MTTYFRTKVATQIGTSISVTTVTPSSPTTGSVTLTFATQSAAPYAVNSTITVTGISVAGYNGSYTVTACTTSTVTYTNSTTGAATGGTISANVLSTGATSRYTLIGCNLANTTDYDIYASVQITDANQNTGNYISQMMIPPYSSLKMVTNGEKIILMENTSMTIISDTATSIDAVISYAEIV
jgi:hypothetical protein